MKRPYVVVAADFIRTGGMDRANFALARHLARRGHETHLVSFSVAPELAAEPNVRVHLARRPWGKHTLGGPFLGSRAIAEALRAGAGAQVIANGGNCFMPGAVNWVHYVHAADAAIRKLRDARKMIACATERIALAKARLVVANSERTRRDLVRYIGVDDAKIHVVYLGVDAEDFRPRSDAERAELRAALGWTQGRPKVVFVGALADGRKGFGTVYRAWQTLCRAPGWDADLVVLGMGRLLDAWRDRVRADGLAGRVTFLGLRNDVPRVVGAADLVVAPSLYEPYGLAVHEALCLGVPAITAAQAGVAEMYPAALADWLLPDPKDDVDLAGRIRRWRAAGEGKKTELLALSDRLRARDWEVVARDIATLCEA